MSDAYLCLPVVLQDVDFCIGCPARIVTEGQLGIREKCAAKDHKVIEYTRPEWCPLEEIK
jgi:hypothetical protein